MFTTWLLKQQQFSMDRFIMAESIITGHTKRQSKAPVRKKESRDSGDNGEQHI